MSSIGIDTTHVDQVVGSGYPAMPPILAIDRSDIAAVDPVEVGDRMPRRTLDRYAAFAMLGRRVQRLEKGLYYAELPGFRGVWADGDTAPEAESALREALLGWLEIKIEDHDGDIPVVAGIDLNAL